MVLCLPTERLLRRLGFAETERTPEVSSKTRYYPSGCISHGLQ